jgi:hexosaminidase
MWNEKLIRFGTTKCCVFCKTTRFSHFLCEKMRMLQVALVGLMMIGYCTAHVSTLWPQPNSVYSTSGSTDKFLLCSKKFKYVAHGDGASSAVLQDATERYNTLTFSRHPTFPDVEVGKTDQFLKTLDIYVTDATGVLTPDMDEDYSLSVSLEKGATLFAATVWGALRGMETFSQLVDFVGMNGENVVWEITDLPLQIIDSPRFSYRGLMIDTARHWLPMDMILQNIDVMSYNKLNVMHWHVVDSQSFPYQPTDPLLAGMSKGAWQKDHIYTAQDIQKVIDYAYLRGIRVVPEFDTPGHTQAWGAGIPDILSHCPNPSEPLDPSNPFTFEVLTALYKELSAVFKDDYVHLGGDEVSFDCWQRDANITKFMKEQNFTDYADVEQYFETTLLEIVGHKLNKKTIVWQEIVNNGLKVRPDTVVDVWKGFDTDTILNATSQGLQVVISGPFYLDHLNDDWDTFYRFDLRDFAGTEAQKALVVGGHGSMWGERVDVTNFMSRTWPRASSIAEKLWTVAQLDVTAAGSRLHDFRCRMVARGIDAEPVFQNNQVGFCPVEYSE